MSRVTGRDGNVIGVEFGRGKARVQPQDELTLTIKAKADILYADAEVMLVRLYVQVGEQAWLSHGLYPVNA